MGKILTASVGAAPAGGKVAVGGAPIGKAELVLHAAARLFMARGYGATSMEAIAREAGVSKATLYAHYANKDRLFAAIVGHHCAKFQDSLAALDLDHADLRAALVQVGHSFLALIMSPTARSIYRIVIGEVPRFPELGRIFYQSGPALVTRRLVDFLQRADARGQVHVPDPVMAAKQFIGALQGPFHMRRLIGLIEQPDEAELERAVLTAVDVFLRGYATGQPPPGSHRE